MKTYGIDKFAARLDEIFEQGAVGKALIIDAYNKATEGINQEVERRIAERLPSKEEAQKKMVEIDSLFNHFKKGIRGIMSDDTKLNFFDEWYRYRLTENKQEGGEG